MLLLAAYGVLDLAWTDWTMAVLVGLEAITVTFMLVRGLKATKALVHDGEAHVPASRGLRMSLVSLGLVSAASLVVGVVVPAVAPALAGLRFAMWSQGAIVLSGAGVAALMVTAVRRREHLLRKDLEAHANEEARLRSTQEASEALVYGVSHDLKAPLVSIDFLLEDLRAHLDDRDPEATQLMERMARNVDRMEAFVQELLVYASAGNSAEDTAPVPLVPMIDDVFDTLVSDPEGKACHLELVSKGQYAITAPTAELRHVVQNLVGNAVKYGRDEGVHVRVTVERRHRDDVPGLEVRVDDDGPGVPWSARGRIFRIFTRIADPLGREIPGTGMGLAMVDKIVRALGGNASVEDGELGGAAFVVWLPDDVLVQVSHDDHVSVADATPRARPSSAGRRSGHAVTQRHEDNDVAVHDGSS